MISPFARAKQTRRRVKKFEVRAKVSFNFDCAVNKHKTWLLIINRNKFATVYYIVKKGTEYIKHEKF